MQGKYKTRTKFYFTKLYRGVLRLVLRPLMHWKKLENPEPGYTVAIAAHWRFPYMLEASLLFLNRQNLTHMDHVICAIDAPHSALWSEAEERMRARFPRLKLEFLYQSPLQSAVLKAIKWGWIDAWLSFCKCIAAAKTRYIALHDNDAMLLTEDFIESRYQAIQDRGDTFLGIRWYSYNGLEEGDRILYTVNMIFDAQFIRNNCHPIECFPHVQLLNGRTVDLDVLCQCQLKSDSRSMFPITAEDWVHPSQVISQFSYLSRGNGYVPPRHNNLFFIPYFEDIGGKPDTLLKQVEELEYSPDNHVSFLGYEMDLVEMDDVHMTWIEEQIERVENSLFGSKRPIVERYLQAIKSKIKVESQKEEMLVE